jgi:hypothetical protein
MGDYLVLAPKMAETGLMRFYRGIAVPSHTVAGVMERIRGQGLGPADGTWRMLVNDLKPRLMELWAKPTLGLADTRPEGKEHLSVCACADKASAVYYATEHNRVDLNDTPIIVSFDADLRDVTIDGRDFLYTVFQLGNPHRARPMAERIYGRKIGRYLDRAWSTDHQHQRFALCDLATQDDDIIRAHLKNVTVIGGRCYTRFRTAFMVRAPVPPERIVSVDPPKSVGTTPVAEVTLDMIRP